jgi:hypothetical protein
VPVRLWFPVQKYLILTLKTMNSKFLNEVLDFCEEQNLENLSFDEFMSIYNSYCDLKYEENFNEVIK